MTKNNKQRVVANCPPPITMTKQQFIKLIKEYQDIGKVVDDVNKSLKKFDPDFNQLFFSRYIELFLETIRIAMDDKADWIGYYIFDLDGKFPKKTVIWENKKPVPLKNYSDLYDIIVNNIGKEEEDLNKWICPNCGEEITDKDLRNWMCGHCGAYLSIEFIKKHKK